MCTTVQGSYTGDPLEGRVPLGRTETYYNKHAKPCSLLSCTQPETTRLLIFAPTMALDCQRHFQTALIHSQLLHLTIIQLRAKCARAKQSSWAALVFLQVFRGFWLLFLVIQAVFGCRYYILTSCRGEAFNMQLNRFMLKKNTSGIKLNTNIWEGVAHARPCSSMSCSVMPLSFRHAVKAS